MMHEITALREAFGPDEAPSPSAHHRARAALLERMSGTRPAVHKRRWRLRLAVTAAVAAATAVSAVAVDNLGESASMGLPFPEPASAAEVLENAAWTAGQKPWKKPLPDQFMYNETRELRNVSAVEQVDPNGPLRPGQTRIVTVQHWKRIDGQEMAYVDNGKLTVEKQGGQVTWVQLPYEELLGLTTPEKVLAWDLADKNLHVDLDALLGQYVVPPAVKAAVFKAIARGDGVRLDPDAVNLDGRPAIGLGRVEEGYLAQELLFDRDTYALIGERVVAIADHTDSDTYGRPRTTHKGDVFRQDVYTKATIVDAPGDTE